MSQCILLTEVSKLANCHQWEVFCSSNVIAQPYIEFMDLLHSGSVQACGVTVGGDIPSSIQQFFRQRKSTRPLLAPVGLNMFRSRTFLFTFPSSEIPGLGLHLSLLMTRLRKTEISIPRGKESIHTLRTICML